MPRHDDEQDLRREQRQRVEQQRLFAIARARGEQHAASTVGSAPHVAERELRGIRCGVELQVPGDFDIRGAERAQAPGVLARLGGDRGERPESFVREAREASISPRAMFPTLLITML